MFTLPLDKAITDMVQHFFCSPPELSVMRRNTAVVVTIKLTMADKQNGSFQSREAAVHFLFKINGGQIIVGSQASERVVINNPCLWKFGSASGTADCQQAITRALVEQELQMRERLRLSRNDDVHQSADIYAVHYLETTSVTFDNKGHILVEFYRAA